MLVSKVCPGPSVWLWVDVRQGTFWLRSVQWRLADSGAKPKNVPTKACSSDDRLPVPRFACAFRASAAATHTAWSFGSFTVEWQMLLRTELYLARSASQEVHRKKNFHLGHLCSLSCKMASIFGWMRNKNQPPATVSPGSLPLPIFAAI